jgi:hypothetical protein
MVKVKENMTGWKMWEHGVPDGRLTVIKQAEDYIYPKGKHCAQWLCECNCKEHNQIIALSHSLRSGNTKSCGCIQKELAAENNKNKRKTNIYDLNLEDDNGKYGIGYSSNTGSPFYFDMDDYDKIKNYCWSESKRKDKQYTYMQARHHESGKVVRMHNLIFDKWCDHIDRNPLNNRKHNLRIVTIQENNINKSLTNKNTSGFIGVGWQKNIKKWSAYIGIGNRKKLCLGYFTEKEDAIKARLEAEAKYFGEFAPQRHLFEEYDIKV